MMKIKEIKDINVNASFIKPTQLAKEKPNEKSKKHTKTRRRRIKGQRRKEKDNIKKFIREYNNCDIKQSKVYSVFDYLYSYYEDERKKYLKNKGKVNSCCNFHKEGFGKLEKHYNKCPRNCYRVLRGRKNFSNFIRHG